MADQATLAAAQVARRYPGILMPFLNPLLGILPGEIQNKPKDWFIYSIPAPSTIGASAQQVPFSIQFQNDSFFVWMAISGIVTAADNVTVEDPAPLTLQVNDSGSGANVFFQPVQWSAIVGSGKEPGVLSFPRVVNPAATYTIYINNLVATAWQVGLQLLGFKVFHKMADLTS